ncbi:MAG: 30S ribosome-binding factor RbfA [Proteobacteria bacterium]|jgi:ribosome-binding factor A|nr:30S ribosome-binding factor RbfA [Alphaproteobacteria bacterium]NCC02941.1 30S ribosome-binding factor RbfA [Pseudomonadota bacterium]
MRSQRQLKVGEEIRHALAILFQRGDVPWPRDFTAPIITVSEVQISPDLRNATAYFTTLDGQGGDVTRKVLNGMAGFFRHEIAKAVRLRYVPKLDFRLDTSFAYASNIERILNDPAVAKDLVKESGDPETDQDDE